MKVLFENNKFLGSAARVGLVLETWRIEWTWISRHRDFWILIMEGLPSVIPKSIVEVLNRLENDEDNLFSWKLTRSQDKFSLTR